MQRDMYELFVLDLGCHTNDAGSCSQHSSLVYWMMLWLLLMEEFVLELYYFGVQMNVH